MHLVLIHRAGEEVNDLHSEDATLKMVEYAKKLVMSGLGSLGYISSIDNLTPEQVQSLLAALAEIHKKTLEIRGQRFLQHSGIDGVDLEQYLEEQARIC